MSGFLGDIGTYRAFLNESGREELRNGVRAFRERYGENWRTEFAAANPVIAELVGLIAENDFADAFDRLQDLIAGYIDGEPNELKRIGLRIAAKGFISGAKPDIERLHAEVKAEIDRPL